MKDYPYGIYCPCVCPGWRLDGLGKFFRRRCHAAVVAHPKHVWYLPCFRVFLGTCFRDIVQSFDTCSMVPLEILRSHGTHTYLCMYISVSLSLFIYIYIYIYLYVYIHNISIVIVHLNLIMFKGACPKKCEECSLFILPIEKI